MYKNKCFDKRAEAKGGVSFIRGSIAVKSNTRHHTYKLIGEDDSNIVLTGGEFVIVSLNVSTDVSVSTDGVRYQHLFL